MRRIHAYAVSLALGVSITALPAALSAAQEPVNSHGAVDTGEQAKQMAMALEVLPVANIWLGKYRQRHRIPALSVAVVKGENTIWSRGYGFTDRKMSMPARPDTIYSICSISKLFTAVAFMQQWEKGTVRLDDTVTTHLPWATLAPDDRESVPITMRGLLTHSAGLPRESVHPYWTGPEFSFPTQAEIRATMSGQSPLYPASTTWQYSNLGLTLVGDTVEAVSGRRYGDYVTDSILKPLGLDNTRPYIPAEKHGGQMAVGWGALRDDGTRPEVALFDAKGINPAAGYSSSVEDLAAFAAWQFRLLRTGKAEVLRASTLRDMQRVHYITPDRKTAWGLGFATYQVNETDIVGHGGSCPGYRSVLMQNLEEEFAIALAMNTMESPGAIGAQLLALFKARIEAKDFEVPEGVEVDLSEYAGFYDHQPWDRESVIVPWAGGLAWIDVSYDEPAGEIGRLKPLGGDRFRVITQDGEERDVVTFHRKQDGSIDYVERFGNRDRFARPLISD